MNSTIVGSLLIIFAVVAALLPVVVGIIAEHHHAQPIEATTLATIGSEEVQGQQTVA